MNTHYTYHILGIAENIWKDHWYIGSRTATHGRTPEEDIGIRYFTTSSNDDFVAQFKAHPEWFVCTILERGYPDVRTMWDDEDRRIKESWNVLGRINRTDNVILFEKDERYHETRRKMYESPEWREKNAAANRKKALDPEWKTKMIAINRKKAQDPEWREKTAAANRKNAQDPEWREKKAAANRKLSQDPEWRAKNAAGIHKRSQDPEFGKKLSEGKKRARAARVTALFS